METEKAEFSLAMQSKAGGLSSHLGCNVRAGLLFFVLHPSAIRSLRASVPQLILLLLLDLLLASVLDFREVDGPAVFNPDGLSPLFFGIPWLLLAAWVTARIAGDESRTIAGAVALAALWFVVSLVWSGLNLLPESVWRRLGSAASLVWWAPFALGLLASAAALARVVVPGRGHGAAAGLATIFLIGLPSVLIDRKEALWVPHQDPTVEAAARAHRMRSANESVLYAQPQLLEEALERVEPGRPGVPEIFLLAVGGHGGQDVFLHEVLSVEALFRERFDTAGRSVVLVNNPGTVAERPIASVTALARSLAVIGRHMNRDEDVLVLFMTSHGSPEHRFDLSLWPYGFDELTPERLQELLQAAGVRYQVVVVSACYSGGFVPPLSGNDSLVISAARPDRNSHGCSHEADWTFFGRAFFDEALRKTHSFEMAFDEAQRTVAEREAAEGLEASEPQIAIGNGIRVALKAVERRLEAGPRP